tara:strand:+ start:1061 stop:1249 length:189 start_codon:yes stop_codon:yes gene_type:complete
LPLSTSSGIIFGSVLKDAGWSSLVARQAHNLKVLGSNPSPAPNFIPVEFRNWNEAEGQKESL